MGILLKEFKPRNCIVSSAVGRSYDPELFCDDILNMTISVVRSRNNTSTLRSDELLGKWNIPESMARKTIQVKNQACT